MIAVRPQVPPAPPGKAVSPPVARVTPGLRPAPGATGLAFAGLLAGAAAAQAPEQPAPPPVPPPGQPAATETIPPGTVLRLLGRDVTGPGGQVVAQIMNVLVDATGQPRAAILDYGGFLGVGKRRIAVAWRALRFAPDQAAGAITLALSQDQLKNAPEFKPDGPLLAAAPPEAAPAEPAPEPPAAEAPAPEPPTPEAPAPAQPAAAPD